MALSWSLSSSPSFCKLLNEPFCYRHKILKDTQVRSQIFSDEGKPASNIVDANLRVLKKRIEEVRTKEKLETCKMMKQNGWNYQSSYYEFKSPKRGAFMSETIELMGLVSCSIGTVFLIGILCIFFVSFMAHLGK